MKRVFISYHYKSTRDRDLAAQVDTVLESFDIRAVTGKMLGGEELTPAVQALIAGCDGLIALATRSPQVTADGVFATHNWVRDELVHARGDKKRTIALVEAGVTLGGMLHSVERVDYDPGDPLPAFIKLVGTIGLWKREAGRALTVQLLPPELSKKVGKEGVLCEYRFRDQGNDPPWQKANVIVEPGGAFAYLHGAGDDARIEIRIKVNSRERWASKAAPQWVQVKLAKGARA